jgi:hypothetical protein
MRFPAVGQVRVGFFENFKSGDTLLLDGDSEGLRSLAGTLRELSTVDHLQVALHELPFVEVHHGLRIYASRSGRSCGATNQGEGEIAWTCPASAWETAADKVAQLSEGGSGHQYLVEGPQITVMASSAEYDDIWWQKHG